MRKAKDAFLIQKASQGDRIALILLSAKYAPAVLKTYRYERLKQLREAN